MQLQTYYRIMSILRQYGSQALIEAINRGQFDPRFVYSGRNYPDSTLDEVFTKNIGETIRTKYPAELIKYAEAQIGNLVKGDATVTKVKLSGTTSGAALAAYNKNIVNADSKAFITGVITIIDCMCRSKVSGKIESLDFNGQSPSLYINAAEYSRRNVFWRISNHFEDHKEWCDRTGTSSNAVVAPYGSTVANSSHLTSRNDAAKFHANLVIVGKGMYDPGNPISTQNYSDPIQVSPYFHATPRQSIADSNRPAMYRYDQGTKTPVLNANKTKSQIAEPEISYLTIVIDTDHDAGFAMIRSIAHAIKSNTYVDKLARMFKLDLTKSKLSYEAICRRFAAILLLDWCLSIARSLIKSETVDDFDAIDDVWNTVSKEMTKRADDDLGILLDMPCPEPICNIKVNGTDKWLESQPANKEGQPLYAVSEDGDLSTVISPGSQKYMSTRKGDHMAEYVNGNPEDVDHSPVEPLVPISSYSIKHIDEIIDKFSALSNKYGLPDPVSSQFATAATASQTANSAYIKILEKIKPGNDKNVAICMAILQYEYSRSGAGVNPRPCEILAKIFSIGPIKNAYYAYLGLNGDNPADSGFAKDYLALRQNGSYGCNLDELIDDSFKTGPAQAMLAVNEPLASGLEELTLFIGVTYDIDLPNPQSETYDPAEDIFRATNALLAQLPKGSYASSYISAKRRRLANKAMSDDEIDAQMMRAAMTDETIDPYVCSRIMRGLIKVNKELGGVLLKDVVAPDSTNGDLSVNNDKLAELSSAIAGKYATHLDYPADSSKLRDITEKLKAYLASHICYLSRFAQ